jgi:hypothetical protein
VWDPGVVSNVDGVGEECRVLAESTADLVEGFIIDPCLQGALLLHITVKLSYTFTDTLRTVVQLKQNITILSDLPVRNRKVSSLSKEDQSFCS